VVIDAAPGCEAGPVRRLAENTARRKDLGRVTRRARGQQSVTEGGSAHDGLHRWAAGTARGAARHGDDVTKSTPGTAQETVTALVASIEAAGMRRFAVIDQQAEARQVGLQLRQTTLVRFASPLAGTPVMEASPLAALDLPLAIVIWVDGEATKLSSLASDALAARHQVPADLAVPLQGIDALTDELTVL